MSSPLTQLEHTTRAVQQALVNTCWYVYWRAARSEANPFPRNFRVVAARRRRDQFQVRLLHNWKWQDVAPSDALFQS